MRLYHLVTDWDKSGYHNQSHFLPEHHADNWMKHWKNPSIHDVVQVFFPESHQFDLVNNGDDVYYVWHEANIMPCHPRFYEICKRIGLKHKIFTLPAYHNEKRPQFIVAKASYLQNAKSINDVMNAASYPAYFKYATDHNDPLRIVIRNSWADEYLFKSMIQLTHPPGMFHYVVEE